MCLDCFKAVSYPIPTTTKSVFSLVDSAVSMALPAFAAERRSATPLLLGARPRRFRSLSPARTALSSKLAARRYCGRMMGQTNGRTDRWTDTQPLHRPCCACVSTVYLVVVRCISVSVCLCACVLLFFCVGLVYGP